MLPMPNLQTVIHCFLCSVQFSSVAQSCPTLWDPMNRSTSGLPVHHQLPEFTETHVHQVTDAIQPSSSVVPFSSCLQFSPPSGSFPKSQFFSSGGQSIGVSASASVLPMNIQNWFYWGLTGWISLQSKGLSRVFSNTTVQKHHFFSTQPSSQSNSHIHSIKTDICSSSFLGLISSQMLCLLINTLSAYYFYLQYLLYILSFKRKKLALPWFSSSITALFSQSLTSKELFTLAFGLPW